MLTVYFVNAFTTDKPLSGNPAGVCILQQWLPEQTMQAIAAQHNLAETAFIVPGLQPHHYGIRWFTPTVEIELCGHATLATAHVLLNHLGVDAELLTFDSASGPLTVSCSPQLTLNFPSRPIIQTPSISSPYKDAFKTQRVEVFSNGKAAIIALESEQAVQSYVPDYEAIAKLPENIVYLTAPAACDYDFVCRVFAPKMGIPEDPVTGSAYTSLGPYWAGKLAKNNLYAHQRSPRGGNVTVEVIPDRVLIGGIAQTILIGQWQLEV